MKTYGIWAFGLAVFISIFTLSVASVDAQVDPPTYNPRLVGSPLEVHIYDNGSVLVHGARIEQIAGNTIYTKVYWGPTFLRLMIRTSEKTQFTKKFGGEIKVTDMQVGDFITIEGDFFSGSVSLDVTARKIKDWSIQTESVEYQGDVVAMSTTTTGFILRTKKLGDIVVVPVSDAQIKLGSLLVKQDRIKVGDKITSAIGTLDHNKKQLSATFVNVYQNMKLFAPRLFEGTLTSVAADKQSLVVSSQKDGKSYTILIGSKTSIVNTAKAPVALRRYVVGDYIRIWGTLRETDYSLVDAEVVRNIDL